MAISKRGACQSPACGPLPVTTVPAIKVKAIDTTGAGDSFVGTFAAKLNEGSEVAMRFGCIAAGLSVTKKGAQSSYPTYEEISTFS